MVNKVLLGGFSVILVVAVVVAAVATVRQLSNKDDANNGAVSPKTSINSIESICSTTYHKESCTKTLSQHNINSSSSPIDIVRAAIDATLNEIAAALNSTQQFGTNYTDDKNKQAMVYCKSLFEESIDLLRLAIEEAPMWMGQKSSNKLSYWIGTVTSLTEGCVDVLAEPELKNRVFSTLENTRQLATNGISIVELFAKAAKEIQDTRNYSFAETAGRMLLRDQEIDSQGYPRWVERKLRGGNWKRKPNFVVAKDGTGDFKSISDAVKAVPAKSKIQTVIYVKAGVYREQVLIPKDKLNIYMYGDGARKTIVTGDKCKTKGQEIDTNPTFAVEGNGTILRSMRFENTAGPEGEQAVALRVKSDLAIVINCHIYAYQDTLYAHAYKQFYRGCVIAGTIDFIFGDGPMILQKCIILVRKGIIKENFITAQGRICPNTPSGIVIHDCQILPHEDLKASKLLYKNYLGRPWKNYARVVIMQSEIDDDLIMPEGYDYWDGSNNHENATYLEFNNYDPSKNISVDITGRVKWPGVKPNISLEEALTFTVASPFFDGPKWLLDTGATFLSGLKRNI